MARVSVKVTEWKPQKGKAKGLMSTYDAVQGNLDTLFSIHTTHKSWGKVWYRLVECRAYSGALKELAQKGKKGDCLDIAMSCIRDLMHLEAQMKRLDKGVSVK